MRKAIGMTRFLNGVSGKCKPRILDRTARSEAQSFVGDGGRSCFLDGEAWVSKTHRLGMAEEIQHYTIWLTVDEEVQESLLAGG